MDKCPQCGRKHIKFPRDCWDLVKVHDAIQVGVSSQHTPEYVAMVQYLGQFAPRDLPKGGDS